MPSEDRGPFVRSGGGQVPFVVRGRGPFRWPSRSQIVPRMSEPLSTTDVNYSDFVASVRVLADKPHVLDKRLVGSVTVRYVILRIIHYLTFCNVTPIEVVVSYFSAL